MTENNGKRSLAVIPCYNEGRTIRYVIQKSKKHVDDVLVIDDGSSDDTGKIAKKTGAKVISHRFNKGKSAGIKTGFAYALANNYDFVVTLDGDAQHNPNEIPILLNYVKNNGHDIILGIRWGKNTEMPLWRKIGKRILDYTTGLGNGWYVTDSQCGFRAFNKKAVENLISRLNGYGFTVESEQLIRAHEAGLKVSSKPVSCKYKGLDTSTKRPTTHAFSVLRFIIYTMASRRSFLYICIPGFILTLIGFLVGIQTLQIYNQTNILNIGNILLGCALFMSGALAVITGLLVNILPTWFKRGKFLKLTTD